MFVTIELTEEQLESLRVAENQKAYAKTKKVIHQPADAAAYLSHMKNLKQEHFVVITLTTRSRVIRRHVISKGTLDGALVHPREAFYPAIGDNAAKIILAHNHPSGDCNPSDDDIAVTKRLVTAGKILGIAVVDHMIIARGGHYSLQAHGHM